MTAQPAEEAHGNLKAYNRHYRYGTEVCEECRAAATAYGRQARESSRRAREVDARTVVPVGWPCKDCTWSPRIKLPDGRIVSWRIERCKKHRGYW